MWWGVGTVCVREREGECERVRGRDTFSKIVSVSMILQRIIVFLIKDSRTSEGNVIQKEKQGLLSAFAAPDFLL